jgi:drug/metabolite transporter (DMT)-like permease
MRTNRVRIHPILLALLAALLFGASAPFGKLLLGQVEPIMLAALLYLGCGFGLLIIKAWQSIGKSPMRAEAKLKRPDLPWLAGATLAGGIAAPIVLLFSLRATPAATASLLLNFEAVATTLIAAVAFKEAVSRRAWWAILTITTASVLLTLNIKASWGVSIGALGILLACVLWGVDNNLTRNISAKDPITIVTIKGLVAGTFSLFLAILVGNPLPTWTNVFLGMLLGSLCYGMSITLFIWAMRSLGAARTSALYGTAPLAGIAISFLLFQDEISVMFLLAVPLMLIGTIFLVYEEHTHFHVHETTMHEHSHFHDDEHHIHKHIEVEIDTRSHSHTHEHAYSEHEHNHMPDTHHRHIHPSEK